MSEPDATDVPTPEPTGPREVSRFEARLLRILRFFLHQVPHEQAMPLVLERLARPKCLSADCVHLVKDSLAKGTVLFLVRAGGWRRDRFLRAEKPIDGRLWDRWPQTDRVLSFSRHLLEFLIWITEEKAAEAKSFWAPSGDELTPADQLVLMRAFRELSGNTEMRPVVTAPGTVFARNPLCWLAYPDELAELGPEAVPDFSPWLSGLGACILEALQPYLSARWMDIERSKGQVGDWRRMRINGQVEERVLQRFCEAAEAADRYDLARFILRTTSGVLSVPNLPLTFWTGGLSGSAPPRLADRLATQRAALAVPRHLETMRRWEQRARTVGYYDEGYQAAKLYLSDWEDADGNVIAIRAETLVGQLRPLRTGTGGAEATGEGDSPADPTM